MALSKPKISIVIIAGNEEKMILDCLKSCSWADEIILIAANSTDKTTSIAQKFLPQIKIYKTFDQYNKNFSKWRNLGNTRAHGSWILYVDADERISTRLQQEIIQIINKNDPNYTFYVVPRANYYLNHRVKFGGSYPDYVKRLFKKQFFKGYRGKLHEEPIIQGKFSYLKQPFVHFTHRDLNSMLQKSIAWTDLEAQELFKNSHPPVIWWRFIRMLLTKFFSRLVRQHMYRDGVVGWISAIFESFDTFMIYARLWELQQKSLNYL